MAGPFSEIASDASEAASSIAGFTGEIGLMASALTKAGSLMKGLFGTDVFKGFVQEAFKARTVLSGTTREFIKFRDATIKTGSALSASTRSLGEMYRVMARTPALFSKTSNRMKEMVRWANIFEKAMPGAGESLAKALRGAESQLTGTIEMTQSASVSVNELLLLYDRTGEAGVVAFSMIRREMAGFRDENQAIMRIYAEHEAAFERLAISFQSGVADMDMGYKMLTTTIANTIDQAKWLPRSLGNIKGALSPVLKVVGLMMGYKGARSLSAGFQRISSGSGAAAAAESDRMAQKFMQDVKKGETQPVMVVGGVIDEIGKVNLTAAQMMMLSPVGSKLTDSVKQFGLGKSSMLIAAIAAAIGTAMKSASTYAMVSSTGERPEGGTDPFGWLIHKLDFFDMAMEQHKETVYSRIKGGAETDKALRKAAGITEVGAGTSAEGFAIGGQRAQITERILDMSKEIGVEEKKIKDNAKALLELRKQMVDIGSEHEKKMMGFKEVMAWELKNLQEQTVGSKEHFYWLNMMNKTADAMADEERRGVGITEIQLKRRKELNTELETSRQNIINLNETRQKAMQEGIAYANAEKSLLEANASLQILSWKVSKDVVKVRELELKGSQQKLENIQRLISAEDEYLKLVEGERKETILSLGRQGQRVAEINKQLKARNLQTLGEAGQEKETEAHLSRMLGYYKELPDAQAEVIRRKEALSVAGVSTDIQILELKEQIAQAEVKTLTAQKAAIPSITAFEKQRLDYRLAIVKKAQEEYEISKKNYALGLISQDKLLEKQLAYKNAVAGAAESADFIRRSWEETFTQRAMNLPSGSFIMPMSTGIMEKGVAFAPYTAARTTKEGAVRGFGTYNQLYHPFQRMLDALGQISNSVYDAADYLGQVSRSGDLGDENR